ncbi:helix-turn-helix transcriptional regulator [Streptomyces sp. SCSIO ZS0520]|uniref:helix-turn-helix transcriptional regulator n=1 Tax=Streptomyces sp. SCSIO ZS0520 TaxID=2892996 RepID=UPI0021DA1FF4|nr:LuxR C-terminal-related transcriptional regulator [Streptomyces sp. SCSIO ZS0520]
MTATLTAPVSAPAVTVRVVPAPGADRVRALAERAGLLHGPGEYGAARAVTVIVAADPEYALRGVGAPGPLVLVCDTVGRAGQLRALRAGAVVLGAAELTADTLSTAVHRAAHPHPSIPYPELTRLLTTGPHPGEPVSAAGVPALTARQTSVLRLMAEGHGNADIALLLTCSEHTVKNVIYEIMARLQARNRAHAVAHAVRHGLV